MKEITRIHRRGSWAPCLVYRVFAFSAHAVPTSFLCSCAAVAGGTPHILVVTHNISGHALCGRAPSYSEEYPWVSLEDHVSDAEEEERAIIVF